MHPKFTFIFFYFFSRICMYLPLHDTQFQPKDALLISVGIALIRGGRVGGHRNNMEIGGNVAHSFLFKK